MGSNGFTISLSAANLVNEFVMEGVKIASAAEFRKIAPLSGNIGISGRN
jgi:hypothetical protein